MIRVFLAVDVPPLASLRKLHRRLNEMGRGVRPVDLSQLHMTVKFFGDVPAERIPAIAQSLTEVLVTTPPVDVRLTGVGVFPRIDRPSVVWVGMHPAEPLVLLANRLDEALGDLGFPRERRPLHPHITLARVTMRPPATLRPWVEEHAATECGAFEVSDVRLYQSELRPDGPRYTVLASSDLTGA